MKLSAEIIEELEKMDFVEEDLNFLVFCRRIRHGLLENVTIKNGRPFEARKVKENIRFHKFN